MLKAWESFLSGDFLGKKSSSLSLQEWGQALLLSALPLVDVNPVLDASCCSRVLVVLRSGFLHHTELKKEVFVTASCG